MAATFPGGTIETLLVGSDPNSFYTYPTHIAEFDLDAQALSGNLRHGGLTTLADARTPAFKKKEDRVLNRQSVSLVGAEDLDYIAEKLELDEEIALRGLLHRFSTDYKAGVATGQNYESTLRRAGLTAGGVNRLFLAQSLGANMVVSNFRGTSEAAEFRLLGRGVDVGPFDDEARKFGRDTATVMVTRPNAPCGPQGKVIEANYGSENATMNLAREFVRIAQGRRGFVGMISKGGRMAVGQAVRFVPYGE